MLAARWQRGVGGAVCVSERRDAVRSVAVRRWLRAGRVLALIVFNERQARRSRCALCCRAG